MPVRAVPSYAGGFVTKDRCVAVIGLGYTGLPLAVAFVEAGLAVEGIDAYTGRVAELNARLLADRRHLG